MDIRKVMLVGILACIAVACEKDLFVEDISEEEITLISPGDSANLLSQNITFIWDDTEDVDKYRFQLATPSFDSLQQLLIDSTTDQLSMSFNLNPGTYEWQVRGENDGYETPYSTFKLIVDSTSNLDGFQLVLDSPSDSFYTNSAYPSFSWESILIATEYNFKIVEGSDFENGIQFTSIVTTENTQTNLTKALENGFYIWGVNAENENSKTPYTTRFIWFDDIAPSTSQHISPTNQQQLFGGRVNFSWTQATNSGSPVSDSIFISSDSTFQTIDIAKGVMGNTYSDSLTFGTYYWRLSSTDKAGNWSGYSSATSFKIQ